MVAFWVDFQNFWATLHKFGWIFRTFGQLFTRLGYFNQVFAFFGETICVTLALGTTTSSLISILAVRFENFFEWWRRRRADDIVTVMEKWQNVLAGSVQFYIS